jgi:hypothetical protein
LPQRLTKGIGLLDCRLDSCLQGGCVANLPRAWEEAVIKVEHDGICLESVHFGVRVQYLLHHLAIG